MPGDVVHVMALGEQSVDFTEFGISDNFGYPVSTQFNCLCNLLLSPAQATQSNSDRVSADLLASPDIGYPAIYGLLCRAQLFGKGVFRPLIFQI